MPAWYDLYGLTPSAEEDEEGIDESTKILHSMIDAVSFIKSCLLSFVFKLMSIIIHRNQHNHAVFKI